jgi:hypothetical protein
VRGSQIGLAWVLEGCVNRFMGSAGCVKGLLVAVVLLAGCGTGEYEERMQTALHPPPPPAKPAAPAGAAAADPMANPANPMGAAAPMDPMANPMPAVMP